MSRLFAATAKARRRIVRALRFNCHALTYKSSAGTSLRHFGRTTQRRSLALLLRLSEIVPTTLLPSQS